MMVLRCGLVALPLLSLLAGALKTLPERAQLATASLSGIIGGDDVPCDPTLIQWGWMCDVGDMTPCPSPPCKVIYPCNGACIAIAGASSGPEPEMINGHWVQTITCQAAGSYYGLRHCDTSCNCVGAATKNFWCPGNVNNFATCAGGT
jgi:hypothetical protein